MLPKNAEAYGQRGLARLRQGRANDADADLKKAYQLDPNVRKKLQPLVDEAKKTTGKPEGTK
jgi:Flp pilus assembly protein TadD